MFSGVTRGEWKNGSLYLRKMRHERWNHDLWNLWEGTCSRHSDIGWWKVRACVQVPWWAWKGQVTTVLWPRHGLSGLIFIVRNKSRSNEFLLSFNGKCCKVLHQYCIGRLARAIAVAISGRVVNGSMTREYSTRQLLPSLILLLLGCMLFTGCSKAGASPDQPIAFSHRIHVENQIDCSYCHDYYEDYDVAGCLLLQRVSTVIH